LVRLADDLRGVRTSPPNALLRVSEAAELAGLSTRAIYRAIERRELRAARLCSRLRIPRAAFEEWIERGTVRPVERPTPTPAPPLPVPGSFRALLAQRSEEEAS
jgi:excisionase family DNA binding protein